MELLVIGNGFDLYSGLKTNYQHFFEDRYSSNILKDIENYYHTGDSMYLKRLNKLEGLSFWDLYFILTYLYNGRNKEKSWANIEEEIRIFLVDQPRNTTITKKGIQRQLNKTRQSEDTSIGKMLVEILRSINKKYVNNTFEGFIFQELLMFEKVFGGYINNESKSNINYQDNSTLTIEKLVTDQKNTHVLSFNYTEVHTEKVSHVEYVHGESSKNIIFGIDTVGLEAGSDEYRYSKTYRKLLMNVENQKHESLPKEVEKIVFFGHSLSLADFSYFQSIFDFYSIYDSTIELKFVFSVYEETKRSEIINNQLKSVTSLFSEYGKKMMNSHQGQNMLHKLILENRIKVVEIKNS